MSGLFISHASVDKPLAHALVDLIEGGIGVPAADIFYSSSKIQGVPPGTSFTAHIKKRLENADVVLALISENYYASAFSMAELGAVWISALSFVPILVPPLEFDSLKAVLQGIHVLKLGDRQDLDQLYDESRKRLKIAGHGTPRWTDRRDEFLKRLPSLLKEIKSKGPVPREKYELLHARAGARKKKLRSLQQELDRLAALNTDLKRVKDASGVSAAVRKHSKEPEAFETLVDAARDALRPLPQIVCEALYHTYRGAEQIPFREEDWDSLRKAEERGFLEDVQDDPRINFRNPKIVKASEALDGLRRWLSGASESFFEWYTSEHEGEDPNLKLRQFWEEHLGL